MLTRVVCVHNLKQPRWDQTNLFQSFNPNVFQLFRIGTSSIPSKQHFFPSPIFPLERRSKRSYSQTGRIETLKSIPFRGLARFPKEPPRPTSPRILQILLSESWGLTTYRSSSYEIDFPRFQVVATSRLVDLPRFRFSFFYFLSLSTREFSSFRSIIDEILYRVALLS